MKDDRQTKPTQEPGHTDPPFLEIGPVGGRRWSGLTLYLLAFAGVGMVLVLLLLRLGSSWPIAVGAVGVMIVGMLVMAHWAGRNVL